MLQTSRPAARLPPLVAARLLALGAGGLRRDHQGLGGLRDSAAAPASSARRPRPTRTRRSRRA